MALDSQQAITFMLVLPSLQLKVFFRAVTVQAIAILITVTVQSRLVIDCDLGLWRTISAADSSTSRRALSFTEVLPQVVVHSFQLGICSDEWSFQWHRTR